MAHRKQGDEAKFAALDDLEVNADQLSDLFHVTKGTVLQYARDGGMPRIARGRYKLLDCVNWYVNKLRGMVDGEGDLSEEKRKLITAQRHRHEIEAERLRGQLLEAEEVASHFNEVGVIFSTQLDALPARAAPQCINQTDTGELVRILQENVRDVRRSTSTAIENYIGSIDTGGHNKPAPIKKRRRVGRRK